MKRIRKISIIDRLLSPTPKFWRGVQFVGGGLAALTKFYQVEYPGMIPGNVLWFIAGIAGGMVTLGQFATKNNPQENAQ